MIFSKFGKEDLGWWATESQGPYGVGFWKDILKEASWVKEDWKFRIGNGSEVRFWTDYWCGPSTLNHSYPTLFEVVINKLETMAEAWDHAIGSSGWKLNFV